MLVNIAWPSSTVLLWGILASSGPEKPSQAVGSLSVVVNSENVTSNLSKRKLKQILRGESRDWKGSSRRVQLVLPTSKLPARGILEQRVYFMRINRHFRKAAYRQTGGKPLFRKDIAALELVKNNPAAIAVVPTSTLRKDPKLKVLTIGKKKPGSVGYFLNSSIIK